jgi:hypothetical protein
LEALECPVPLRWNGIYYLVILVNAVNVFNNKAYRKEMCSFNKMMLPTWEQNVYAEGSWLASIAGTNFQTWNSERTWMQDGSNLVDRSCNLRERTMLFVFAWELVKLSIQLWLFASHHQCRIAIIAYIIDTWSIKSNLRGYCYHVLLLTRWAFDGWIWLKHLIND